MMGLLLFEDPLSIMTAVAAVNVELELAVVIPPLDAGLGLRHEGFNEEDSGGLLQSWDELLLRLREESLDPFLERDLRDE